MPIRVLIDARSVCSTRLASPPGNPSQVVFMNTHSLIRTWPAFIRAMLLTLTLAVISSVSAVAQNFYISTVGNGVAGNGNIRTYALDGTVMNASLMPGQSYPIDVAISGAHLYILNRGVNSVAKYNLDGTLVNALFIAGLNDPQAIAIHAGDIYIANAGNNTVGKYSTNGSVINASFISLPSNPLGLAVSGGDLYVSVNGVSGQLGTVQKFTTAGALVNDGFITGLVQPRHMTISSGDLYLINGATLSVSKYDTSTGAGGILLAGGIGDPLINVPIHVVVSGTDLYVASLGGDSIPAKIGHYTTSGATVNADLITGLDGPYSFAIGSPAGMGIGLYAGLTVTGTIGAQYTIEYTTSLNDPVTWTPITSGTLATSPYLYIDTTVPAGTRFYRAVFQ